MNIRYSIVSSPSQKPDILLLLIFGISCHPLFVGIINCNDRVTLVHFWSISTANIYSVQIYTI